MVLDLRDKRILSVLDMDARIPFNKLAKRLRLSRQVVDYRVKRLQKNNVVFGALTIFDSGVLGNNWYRIIMRLHQVTKEQKEEFLLFLKNHENMCWLGEVGGNWDLAMNFICKDNVEFNNIFEKIIAKYGKYVLSYEVLIYVNIRDYSRAYILENNSSREEFFHTMKKTSYELDEIDKKIVKELSIRADKSNVEIGNKLGVSRNTVKNRIDNMRQEKFLLGFRLMVNPNNMGYSSHMLFLGMTKLDVERERELFAYLKMIPSVTFVVKHIGRWRVGMEIETKDEREFQDIFVDIRGRFSDIITDFETFPIFKDHIINYMPEGVLK